MKTFLIVVSTVAVTLLLAATGAFFALRATLAPLPGEWSVPLALGPLTIQAGVPSMLRLATSAWGGPLLAGRRFSTRHGSLHFGWAREGVLHVRCAPCELQSPALGDEPLRLAEVDVAVHRLGESLWGSVQAGRVRGEWRGTMLRDRIRVRLEVPATPIADGYALFAAEIPELQRARIEGVFTLRAELVLPDGAWTVQPRVDGFAVGGLGTEALAGARTACSRRASRLTPESWLSRAVIAAEDQRFWDHPGYDIVEVAESFTLNQERQRIARGASTLSQQAARLLVTGGERKPVRKLRELLYAVEMEQTLGKARILHLYLDNAPWGEGQCGAEAASLHYFGVRAHELKMTQAAWLAAMLHNPDMEAKRWADRGTIDTSRAQWVLLGMRGVPRPRRLEIAEDIPLMDWKPWWSQPAMAK
ncbi:biosynthetic peptidoglycan transglycosylase [Ramlibacter sp. PS4R-6]|uniref:biosynthetic peptidoglycan transglycosylase n=1 Tax=Ramlibacter sp. PS4R-6 TaxID=3133438 RepID=UPI0030A93D56